MDPKFLLATFVLLIPAVSGCIEFEASMPSRPNDNELLHSVLLDHGQVVCTMKGFPFHANVGTVRDAPVLYFCTCLDKFLADFNGDTGEVRYENPSGHITFSAHLIAGVWRACEYGCSDSQCLRRNSVSSQRRSLLDYSVESSPSSSPCPVKTSGKNAGRCGWVLPAGHRSSFAILYGCLATLFACSWSILQLNLPGPDESNLQLLSRKAKWMAIALAFPEFIGGIAVVEFLMAWKPWLSRKGIKAPDGTPWTLTHWYFANMGGFVLHSHGAEQLPLNGEALQLLINENKVEVPTVTKDQILDRSKVGFVAKILAFGQVVWFAVQVTGRYSKGYAVTPLEWLTVFVVVLSILTYIFEWCKPTDVTVPIDVNCGDELGKELEDRIAEIYNRTYGIDHSISDNNKFEVIKSTKRIPFGDVVNYRFTPGVQLHGCIEKTLSNVFLFIGFLSGIYNGSHLLVTSDSFPSVALHDAWTAAAKVAIIISGLGLLLVNKKIWGKWTENALRITLTMYCCARLCPFLIAFICMWSQPPSAYAEFHWTHIFPHIS